MTTHAAAARKKRRSPANVIRKRPAETATPVVMVIAMFVGSLFDLDSTQVAYLAVIFAFVPAAVTWTVELARG